MFRVFNLKQSPVDQCIDRISYAKENGQSHTTCELKLQEHIEAIRTVTKSVTPTNCWTLEEDKKTDSVKVTIKSCYRIEI